MLDQELARLQGVSSTRFGEFAQIPSMIVLFQCCFLICLYQFRGFGLLAWEIKTWCWVGQETGVYLLVDISCWRGNFLQGGENEHIFGWLPPSPSPPHHCVERCIFFHPPPFWISTYVHKYATPLPQFLAPITGKYQIP